MGIIRDFEREHTEAYARIIVGGKDLVGYVVDFERKTSGALTCVMTKNGEVTYTGRTKKGVKREVFIRSNLLAIKELISKVVLTKYDKSKL